MCALKRYFTDVSINEDKVIPCLSRVIVNNVKFATQDVFVVDKLQSERIPLFFQVKFILNVDSMWALWKTAFPKTF